jgi:hypothetical protein
MLTGRTVLWWLVGSSAIWIALLLTTLPAAAHQIYVPLVSTDGSALRGAGGEPTQCGLNNEELAVARLMLADGGQQRENPVCNSILAQVARARARDMALRDYFSHTNPDGDGPNLLVREAGYPLPDWYADEQAANNIESIGGGYADPNAVWQGWLGSSGHRPHILGTDSFYADQEAYGIGYYFSGNSKYKHYWVFLSAPVAE